MNKTITITAAVFGLLAIVLGAFGAHGLEKMISTEALSTFETGVKYQMYHALFLLLLGIQGQLEPKDKKVIFWLITLGIILFSFSIYLLATNSLSGFDFKRIGFVTPIGGSLLIVGWAVFGYRVFKRFN